MASEEALRVIEELRRIKGAPRPPLLERRAGWLAACRATPLPEGTHVESVSAGGVAAEWVTRGSVHAARCILLLHGGGYVSGSAETHRELAARLSGLCSSAVLVVDYRLAPEHPFPAAVEDVLCAYRYVLSRGTDAAQIALCGDSAGGGLVAALLLRVRELGLPWPAGAALLSPWLDLEVRSPSAERNAQADPSIDRQSLVECGTQYVAEADPQQVLASPLHADLSGFPPLYVNVGDLELLLDDALIFARRAELAGAEVTLSVGRGMWHVYPAWAGSVPEAMAELQAIGAWLGARLGARLAG